MMIFSLKILLLISFLWLKIVHLTVDRNLYIIGGQRGEYLNDFFAINVDTLTVNFLSDRVSSGLLQYVSLVPLLLQKNVLLFLYVT